MARLARIKAVDKMTSISKADVIAAQQAWGEGIVAISKAHSDGGDFKARATQHINTLYAYGEADVMFKPTMAAKAQFRVTSVSYTHLTLPTKA